MALTWGVTGIKDYQTVTTHPDDLDKPIEDQRWNNATEALVWLSLGCGFHAITNENWEKIYCRIYAYERACGAQRRTQAGPIYVSVAEVKSHIGLRTNASNKTDAAFAKLIMTYLYDDANAELKNQIRG